MKLSRHVNYGFAFSYLVRVEQAKLEGDYIVGYLASAALKPQDLRDARLITEFLNCPDDEASILAFTKKYGPVDDGCTGPGSFRMPLERWRGHQRFFRSLWRDAKKYRAWETDSSWEARLAYRNGKIVYSSANLYAGLYLSLVTCDPILLRYCKLPGCKKPHFVLIHGIRKYCSYKCQQLANRKARLAWWDRNKEPILQKRQAERRKKAELDGDA